MLAIRHSPDNLKILFYFHWSGQTWKGNISIYSLVKKRGHSRKFHWGAVEWQRWRETHFCEETGGGNQLNVEWKSNLLEARGNPFCWIWIFSRQFKIQPPCDDHCGANSDKKRWLHGGWHATMIQHQRSTSLSCSLNHNCSSIKEEDHKGWQRSSMS